MVTPVRVSPGTKREARQIAELKEVVTAAGPQLVFFPRLVSEVEQRLKQLARAGKTLRPRKPSARDRV